MKPLHLTFLLFILALSPAVMAEDLIYHTTSSDEVSLLKIDNQSYQDQDFWLLFYEDSFIEERHFEIRARSQKTIQVSDYKQGTWNMSVLTKSNQVKLPAQWQIQKSTLFEKSVAGIQKLELNPINLWKKPQDLTLEYFDLNNRLIQKNQLTTEAYLKSKSLQLEVPKQAIRLKIKSTHLLTFPPRDRIGFLIDNSRELPPAAKTTHYFLVSNGTHSSFIAPIKDPDLVAKARQEISNYQGLMVFAEIDYNEKDLNRNLTHPLKPYWSWKLTEVTELSQIGADWCQTYPEMIERMLDLMISQKQVCFRGQRIIKELRPEDLK
jgi:hypothetical protein